LIALLTIIAVVAGCSDAAAPNPTASSVSSESAPIPPSATTPAPTPGAGLAAEFQEFAATLNSGVGVVLTAVGDGTSPVTLGTWTHGPAWSTIKVPLSIAALRESPSADVTEAMTAAITRSDNGAAEQVWQSLGTPDVAARRVEAVLSDAGAPATVPSVRKRPEFSAFGQTDWSLTDQVRFLSWAKCAAGTAPIFDLMGEVESDQQWGLGVFQHWQIKGGWGPSESNKYLVRQIGIVTTPTGEAAIAIAAEPATGSFGDGTQVLTAVANWLKDHTAELPAGQCSGGSSSTVSDSTAENPATTVDAPTGSVPAVSPSP
jgi:hypothetical protein